MSTLAWEDESRYSPLWIFLFCFFFFFNPGVETVVGVVTGEALPPTVPLCFPCFYYSLTLPSHTPLSFLELRNKGESLL